MNSLIINCMLFVLPYWTPVFCDNRTATTGEYVTVDLLQTNDVGINEVKTSAVDLLQSNTIEETPTKSSKLICPGKEVRRPFFATSCKVTKECLYLGKNMVCCDNRCMRGVTAPPPEPVHSPTLFGLVDRVCPNELIPEIFEIKTCTVDTDCSPRICCPEKMQNGDIVGYCRTAEAKLDRIPGARRLMEPFRLMMSYMQCTPPPPPILDLFPKECRNPLDCFPNLCCQEKGKRFCRPPRRSLLTLLTTIAQRIVPSETARDIITRLAP